MGLVMNINKVISSFIYYLFYYILLKKNHIELFKKKKKIRTARKNPIQNPILPAFIKKGGKVASNIHFHSEKTTAQTQP